MEDLQVEVFQKCVDQFRTQGVNLAGLCEADQVCRENLDIPGLVSATLKLFKNGPLPYSYADPSDPAVIIEGVVTADDMVALIYEMQGSVIGAFSLPATLQILSDDDVVTAGTGPYATRFGLSMAKEYVLLCSILGIEELSDSTDKNVSVDIPVLLLRGNLDVATPSYRSQIVADALPDATHLVFPGRTHVQLAGVNLCAFDILYQFTSNPDAPLDTSCLQNAPAMGFILPDGTMSTEQP